MEASPASSLHRRSGSNSSAIAGFQASSHASALHAASSSSGLSSSSSSMGPTGKQEQTSVDAWIVQKLKHEWSSCEFGGMLTKEKLSDAVLGFRHLDTPIKVRFLLSFLSMRREDVEDSKFSIVEIIDAAEHDSEEWVKVSAGIVKQYIFMSEDGSDSGATFFHEQIAKTSAKVIEAINSPPSENTSDWGFEDFFCHENAFLNPSVRPEMPVSAVKHFTVVETSNSKKAVAHDGGWLNLAVTYKRSALLTWSFCVVPLFPRAEKSSERKPVPHRPQMARPALHPSSASNAPTRLTPTTSKPPPPPKKNMTELSEIRRKADAGRFKRHRSRISMIDIDEVKQIESEKAQKAEERKKQRLVSKDKPAMGDSQPADKKGAQDGADANEDDRHDESSQNVPQSATEAYSQHDEDEDDHEDSHHRDHQQDDEDEHDHNGSAMHHHGGVGSDDEQRSEYIPDGTQALLNAAFHSTKDIMTEVVSQQQQYQQQHYEPEEQQHYHHGFEPEDANQHLPYAYGGFNSSYAPQYADQSHLHQQQQQQFHQPQYHHQLQPQQLQYQQHQYGFLDDQQQQQQQQQPAPPRLPGFDGVQHNVNQNGNYMDGPEYWR